MIQEEYDIFIYFIFTIHDEQVIQLSSIISSHTPPLPHIIVVIFNKMAAPRQRNKENKIR